MANQKTKKEKTTDDKPLNERSVLTDKNEAEKPAKRTARRRQECCKYPESSYYPPISGFSHLLISAIRRRTASASSVLPASVSPFALVSSLSCTPAM